MAKQDHKTDNTVGKKPRLTIRKVFGYLFVSLGVIIMLWAFSSLGSVFYDYYDTATANDCSRLVSKSTDEIKLKFSFSDYPFIENRSINNSEELELRRNQMDICPGGVGEIYRVLPLEILVAGMVFVVIGLIMLIRHRRSKLYG
ncbi:hypothetical protein BH23PAT2_BH23PAT2_02620 [soil metagenome]